MQARTSLLATLVLAALVLASCTGTTPPADEPRPATEPAVADTPPPEDTAPPVDTGDTAPPLVVFDCDTIPVQPTSVAEIPGAKGYHDLAFTTTGLAIGNAAGNFSLLTSDYAGTTQVFVPGSGTIQQMVWLPDGDLAAASDDRGIVRIAPNGAVTVINGNIRPYGLILGPDAQLYAADQDQVWRVDPTTGDAAVVVPSGALPDGAPRVIAFDLAYTQLYIGTYLGSGGTLFSVPLDGNLDPVGPPGVFATGVGTGAYHDAIGVDLCGYLYVPDYSTSSLYRVSSSGQVQRIHQASGFLAKDYGHGVEWGNGVGGWRDDAIYLPLPYGNNGVLEIVVGVPSRDWTGGVATHVP